MTPITKGLVPGVATSAQRDSRVVPNKVATWPCDSHVTPDEERAVGPQVDRCFPRLRLLQAIIEPLEVQRPGRTRHDRLGDLIRGSRIDLDPRSGLRLEDFRQTAKADTDVNAQLRLPGDGDPVVAVHALHAGPLARFVRVVGSALHIQISSGFGNSAW
jgi:hypothetical protein